MKKKRRVPMLYNNMFIKLPMRPRPARVSLAPYEAAAPLVLVDVEVPLVTVPVPVPLPLVVGFAVVPQVNVPWMTLPFSDWKPLQSMEAVL